MSRLAEALRAMGIYNNHNLLSRFGEPGRDVWCEYHAPEPRSCTCQTTRVYSPSHKTRPDAPWYDHGRQAFIGNRAESMPLAVTWASERYGIDEWAPSPFGGKVPAYVRKAAERAVREQAAT